MATFFNSIARWFGGGRALGNTPGKQDASPGASLVEDTLPLSADTALQLATVWACVDRRAKVIASLPWFVYATDGKGMRQPVRTDRLWQLLHDSPNARMTPYEFWVAMMLNHDLRGNAYARIERAAPARGESIGEAVALWPMPADQVEVVVLPDGSVVYEYRLGADVVVLAEQNVLHLKDMGNGTTGLPRLDYMKATTTEATRAQETATRTFALGGRTGGVLMTDNVINASQREMLRTIWANMSEGPLAKIHLLEGGVKFQQLAMSPEDIQLLPTRQHSTEELCRFFDVPPVLVHHANVTSWGSGIEQIVEGWYKSSIGPLTISIQQAVRKRVMTPGQRARLTAEQSLDALLRASLKDRVEIYSKQVQNGLKTRNECRQLENDPPMDGGNVLTAQTNLAPIDMLGKTIGGSNAPAQTPLSQ